MKFEIERASWCGVGGERPTPTAYTASSEPSGDRNRVGWAVEIGNLADLLALIEKEGQVIVSQEKPGEFSITIYDYYVE